MLNGHPNEAANHSVGLPPLHKVPFHACFHAYVFNVWTARGTYLVPEYCKPGGFLDTSAPHLSGEQSYIFSYKIFEFYFGISVNTVRFMNFEIVGSKVHEL